RVTEDGDAFARPPITNWTDVNLDSGDGPPSGSDERIPPPESDTDSSEAGGSPPEENGEAGGPPPEGEGRGEPPADGSTGPRPTPTP
ncbi:MAG: hypothetical protein AAF125_16350, partial [Chloroflexota bacterium]